MKNALIFLCLISFSFNLFAQNKNWKSGYYLNPNGQKITGFFDFKSHTDINGITFTENINEPNAIYLTPEVVQEIFIDSKYHFLPIKRKVGGVDNLFFGMRAVDGVIDLYEVDNEKADDQKLYYINRNGKVSLVNKQNLQGFLLNYFTDCQLIIDNVKADAKHYRYHFNSLSDLVLDYQNCVENSQVAPEFILERMKITYNGGIQLSYNSGNFTFPGSGYYNPVEGLDFSNMGFGVFGEMRLKVAGIRAGLGYQKNEAFSANQIVITHPDYNMTDITINVEMIEIPISFRYYLEKNDWSFFPELGFILDFHLDAELLDPDSRRVELVDLVWTTFELGHEVRSFSMGAFGGFGIGKNIGENYRIGAGYKFIWKNLNSKDVLKTEYDFFQMIHQPYVEFVRKF